MILIGFVAVVALPLGIAAAIYLQEYAKDTRINRLLTTNIRNLAGVPSIVYGILGLVVFVQTMRAITGPDTFGRSYISGGLTLAVLVLPIVILITMEALRAVPKSIREAAYGVGATRWEVVRSHVMPYAAAGVFTGVILSLARAFGETAPLLLVGAVTGYLSTPGGRITPRDPPRAVHRPSHPDLLVVSPRRRWLEGQHGGGDRRAPRDHPRREPRRDPAEEPV